MHADWRGSKSNRWPAPSINSSNAGLQGKQRGLTREEPKIEIRKGIPVMVHGPGAIPITNELVRSLLDEE